MNAIESRIGLCSQDSEVSNEFFHPCEKSLVREIILCGNLHRSIKRFVLEYSSQAGQSIGDVDTARDDSLPRGLYLQALADSIDSVLDPFRRKLYDLVEHHVRNPNTPISYFYTRIKEFEPFFQFLQNFIVELQSRQYHGCAILKLLHKHNFNGNPKIMTAIRAIRKHVYAIWLRQLSQWLIYGRLVDAHEEFFIVHSETNRMRNVQQSTVNYSTGSTHANVASESTSVIADPWHYEVCYDMLPPYSTPSWAEKVLFIGQTVRMLNSDPRKTTKRTSVEDGGAVIIGDDDSDIDILDGVGNSLWNKQEHVYFNKLQALYNDDSVDIGAYESIVNEIKVYVTERLSEIAFNQADLIMHLRLVKDYYLLGRGELFLEFINQIDLISAPDGITEHLARDVSRAFQVALNRTFIDLEQLTLFLPLVGDDAHTSHIDNEAGDAHHFLRLVELKFKVKWPLHLFFSPLILQRYNQLFRFLLQIRKLQNDLHAVWRSHRERKIAGNSTMALLRNKLLFLVDNLQYYLQVDVLESQFSILIATVQNSKDFEFIQRAHSVFQANIMSLCFLLNANVADTSHLLLNATTVHAHVNEAENPVLTILKNIMRAIRMFCTLNATCSDPLSRDEQQLLDLNDRM